MRKVISKANLRKIKLSKVGKTLIVLGGTIIVVGLVVSVKGHFNNVEKLEVHNKSLKDNIALVEATNEALEGKNKEQEAQIKGIKQRLATQKKERESKVLEIEEAQKQLESKDSEIARLKKLQDKIKQNETKSRNSLVVSSRGGNVSSVDANRAKAKGNGTEKASSSTSSVGNWITMQASAYTNSPSENGGYATTATGDPLVFGMVAVDPNFLPLGTRINIEGYGNTVFKCSDTGGAIKGNRIDILLGSKSQAMQFGRRTVRVRVVK